MRDARREQARFAASDAYGETEVIEDDRGRTAVKPRLTPPTLSELLLLAKIKKAEAMAKAARSEPSGHVHELLSKARTRAAPIPEADARPPAPRSGWDWLRRRSATPKLM